MDSSDAKIFLAELPAAVNVLPKNSNGEYVEPEKSDTLGLISNISLTLDLLIVGRSLYVKLSYELTVVMSPVSDAVKKADSNTIDNLLDGSLY